MATKFLSLNSSNKANDPERALFDFSTDVSISQVRKDFYAGNSEAHFPLFNSHAYFSLFLDQPEDSSFQESQKSRPFERKPVRIQVISALQKAMHLRGRNRLPLEPLTKTLTEFVEKGDGAGKLRGENLDIVEEAFEEFIGFCRDPNFMLKQEVVQDTLGVETGQGMRAYQRLCREHEQELVSDVGKENMAILADFMGVEDEAPVPVLGDGFMDLLLNLKQEDMDFDFGAADAEGFYTQLNQFFEANLGENYYTLPGDNFAQKITGFCEGRRDPLTETQIKLIFKSAKTNLDLELDDSSAFARISFGLVKHMLSENSKEAWKLQLVDELQESMISSRQLKTVVSLSPLLEDIPTLPSSITLERAFASEIDRICSDFSGSETTKLISLLKLYAVSLDCVIRGNLKSTCLALSATDSDEARIEICLDGGHAALLGLSSGRVLSSLSGLIDSQLGKSDDFILADLRAQMDSLLTQLRAFITIHPLFATSSTGLEAIEDPSPFEILRSLDYHSKELQIRESPMLTARALLLDRLLPANTVLHHFLFSTSQHAYQRDMMYLLDLERNLEPLAAFLAPFSEDFRLQLETWLQVMTDNPTMLKEFDSERKSLRELAEATYSLHSGGRLNGSPETGRLCPETQLSLLDWHCRHLRSQIDPKHSTPFNVSELLADLPATNSDLLFVQSSSQIQALVSTASGEFTFADSFASKCADCSKNSAFLRFKEGQLAQMQKSFFENHMFQSTHGVFSQILNLASFKLGDIEFFSESFHDPRLLPSNPILVKKQSYLFLLTLLRNHPDPLTLRTVPEEMSVELSNCFPSDRSLFEVALQTRVDPDRCLELFEERFMGPLYFSAFKEKLSMFMRGYLFGKTQQTPKGKTIDHLEENDQMFNPSDPFSREHPDSKNRLLEDLRFDKEGNAMTNGNEIVTGFDPSKHGEDPFRALGELDLRTGSVIDFTSSLSTLRPELVRAKVEALLRHMDGAAWKEMYQRDSEKSFENAIEQNYRLTDEAFWGHFKNYVDEEVFKVAQVRRDYRGILKKQLEMNKKNLEQGRIKQSFEDAARRYYKTQPKWDSSPAREKFDKIAGDQLKYDEIVGRKDWRRTPEAEEMGQEAGWFNAAKMTGVGAQDAAEQASKSPHIVVEKGEQTVKGLESWKLVEKLSRMSDRDMMEVMWRSAQGEKFAERVELSRREKELVLEVGQDYFQMLERKEKMDLARSTTAAVRQARELELRVFEDVLRMDFVTALQNKAPGTPLDFAESRFQEVRDYVMLNAEGLFGGFTDKWGLQAANVESQEKGVMWVIEAYNRKLEENDRKREGDLVDDLSREIERMRGGKSLFEEEKQKARKQHERFQMQSELRKILGTMNQIVCHEKVIEHVAGRVEEKPLQKDESESESGESRSESSDSDDFKDEKKKKRDIRSSKGKKKGRKVAAVDLQEKAEEDVKTGGEVYGIISNLLEEYKTAHSQKREAVRPNIDVELRTSALDESEDLDEFLQDTQTETQMKANVRLREIDLQKTSVKTEVFLFYVKSLKRHRKIQMLERELEQLDRDLILESDAMEARIESLSPEEMVRYNNIVTLLRLRQDGAEGVQLFEFMTGFRDLQVLYKHREWAKRLEDYNTDRDIRLKEMRRVRAGDVLRSDELAVLQGVGLRNYLAHEIGVSMFLGNASLEKEIRAVADELNQSHGEDHKASELDVADAVLGLILNLDGEWWDRTPSVALLREDLAQRMFPDAQDILDQLKRTPEGQALTDFYFQKEVKLQHDSIVEPPRGEHYTAFKEGGEYSTNAILDQKIRETKADLVLRKEIISDANEVKKHECTAKDVAQFEKAKVSSLKGPQTIVIGKDGVPYFLSNNQKSEPLDWERDLKAGKEKPEGLFRELKLLNMKVKLIEENLRDLDQQKEVSHFNKTIRLERAVARIREQGGEPSKQDMETLMREYGVLGDQETQAFEKSVKQKDLVYEYKSIPAYRRFVHAKAKLMSDYLLRFDPEFRRDFLRNKALDKIDESLDQRSGNTPSTSNVSSSRINSKASHKDNETEEFIPNIANLDPDYFRNDRHGVLVKASASLLGMDIPQTVFKATEYLTAGSIEKHMFQVVDDFVEGVEEGLSEKEGQIFRAKKTRRITELDYFNRFQDVVGLKGHFSRKEQEAIFALFNPEFGGKLP